jgi:hypothetical protein
MTIRRAALYTGGGTLLIAWFSSAASVPLPWTPRPAQSATKAPATAVDDLAANMQAQTKRLRQRLASAPLPQQPVRNPFAFRPTAPPPMRPVATHQVVAPPPVVVVPTEPVLTLIGTAEDHRPEGIVRTAMIATQGQELIVAAVGDTVVQRYKVTSIGSEAIELADSVTGNVRRLALPNQ